MITVNHIKIFPVSKSDLHLCTSETCLSPVPPTDLLLTVPRQGSVVCSFFPNCRQTFVRFVYDSLVRIYSEKAVLLALSLCYFTLVVKYVMPSLISMSV